ncbi:MFS transporter [Streptosporangium algeriense]|uniref:MFS transporter n=1 Tax=Streptosporangium algeriense TaxID=1682748 RepID=A0ABW3DRC8_9ACTN
MGDADFRGLLYATTSSAAGVAIARIAIPLTVIITLHGGPLEAGITSALLTAPFFLIGLPAGAWVDRLPKRRLLLVCQAGRGAILLTIPVAWWLGILSFWYLYAVVLLFGALNVFYDVAYQSYLPTLVGREKVLDGNSRLESIRQVVALGGPAFGGQLVAALTAPVAFVTTSVGLMFSSLFLSRIKRPETTPVRNPRQNIWAEARDGIVYLWSNAYLRSIAVSTGWLNLTGMAAYTVTMVLLASTLRLSPGAIGLFFSVVGVGGIAAAFTVNRINRFLGAGRSMWLVLLVGSPFALVLPAVDNGWTLWVGAFANAVVAFMTVVYNVTEVSYTQAVTPDGKLGRVNASMRFVTWSMMPLGSLLGGFVADLAGTRAGLLICAVAGCLAFVPVWLSPWRRTRELPAVTVAGV